MTAKEGNSEEEGSMATVDIGLKTTEIKWLINKHSLGTLINLNKITLAGFLFGITKYVMISLSKILKPEQYEELAKIIKVKNLPHIIPIENLKLTFEDYVEEKYFFEDYLEQDYLSREIPSTLISKDYLSFVNNIRDFLHGLSQDEVPVSTYYLRLVLDEFSHLLNKFVSDDTSSIWKEAYKIGLLQGKLGLADSILDPELIDKHYREKSGEASQRQWDKERITKEQEEKPIADEVKRMAENIWGRKRETILHDEVAEYIYDQVVKEHPGVDKRYNLRELIFRTIRPIAMKYNCLRGAPRPEFSGTIEKVNDMTKYVTVKSKEDEKTFFVRKTTEITKGVKKICLANLKRKMNVSVKYRMEKGKMVATAVSVADPLRLLRKKVKKKSVKAPKK